MITILATISVLTFGAVCDRVTDDRPAIQAAITQAAATGDEVYIPPGTCAVSRAGNAYYGILRPAGVRIRGSGSFRSSLLQLPTAPGVVLIKVTGDGGSIEDVTLDGNAAAMPPDEHRHGVFVQDSAGLVLRNLLVHNFTGDGIYLYNDASHVLLDDVTATGNHRNGLTMGGEVTGVDIRDSRFVGNAVQQVDSEPGGAAVVSGVSITRSLLDGAGASGDYALTISGTSLATPGHDWRVTDNQINGGIYVVWADDVLIAGNRGTNPTSKPSVDIQRSSARTRVLGNDLAAAGAAAAVSIVGTAGSGPSEVLIAGNRVATGAAGAFGVRAAGAVSVAIVGNDLEGAGVAAAGAAGIYLRATVADRPFQEAIATDNAIRGFGQYGVSVAGNGAAKLMRAEISRNRIDAVPIGMSLDDGSGALVAVVVVGNHLGVGVSP